MAIIVIGRGLGAIFQRIGQPRVIGEVMAGIKLEWVDPIARASPLAPTNAQAAPETDNPVLARYALAMPAVPQEWWQPLRK